jgi:amino acid adenylation domain-containing protein/thioester reductase-like protein
MNLAHTVALFCHEEAPMDAALPCLHELFRRQAERTPEAVAVVDAEHTWTYAELNRMTDAMAGYLQTQGVGTDCTVGIFMEKCAEYICAYIAILKAGGAYMPLELAYPDTLLHTVLDEAQPKVILTQSAFAARLGNVPAATVLCLDRDNAWQQVVYDPLGAATTGLDSLAYVVYSSGTTGAPKGVLAPHRGAVHSYLCRYEFSSYQPGERVACNVFFVWELLRPLLWGATVYVIPDDVIYDPRPLLDFLAAHQITEILFTPSLLESLINAVDNDLARAKMASLKVVWLNGEVVTTALKHRLLEAIPAHTRLLNTYSISECHDVANEDLRQSVDLQSGVCPVGRPIPEVTLRLLDEHRQPVPDGKTGELYIGGPCLARGYLGKPELTAERFMVIDGAPYYRTGDLATLHADGRLEILGRCDYMVKIRGYSVHLGAIEAALLEHGEVASCAVVAVGESFASQRLVAYVVRRDGAAWNIDPHTGRCEFFQHCLQIYLPPYMIPRLYVELDGIPLSPTTGKLDRKRLPAPPTHHDRLDDLVAGQPPSRHRQHEVMSRLWEHVLQLEPRSLPDQADFFDAGGHSLVAVELTRLIETYFQTRLTVREVYHHPTVERIVAHLNGETREEGEMVSLHDEARLDEGIVPPKGAAPMLLGDAQAVLVTGATGFLGAFLLEELLRTTADQVQLYCLVRTASGQGEDGRQRLVDNLRRYGLWDERFVSRLVPVVGDLGSPRLGLSYEAFTDLAERVEFIFHSGALVNYVYPYSVLKPSMVNGTHEVLRLACTGTAKSLHYVSTNGIFPGGDATPYRENADIDAYATRLEGGYGAGKWVAEKLVWHAMSRGLPVCLYRPGNIGHHTRTGAVNPNDFQWQIMQACKAQGCAPQAEDWRFEMTPVDFVVQAMVRFARHPEHFGQVYNIVQADATPAKAVFDLQRECGLIRHHLPLNEWKFRLQARAQATGDSMLDILAQSLDSVEPYLMDTSRYDCTQFERAISRYGLTRPATDRAYFARLFPEGV